MGKIIARKSTETRAGCHSVSELFSTVVIRSFVPIFVAGLAETPFNDRRLKGMMVTQNSNINCLFTIAPKISGGVHCCIYIHSTYPLRTVVKFPISCINMQS